MPSIVFKKLSPQARIPERAYQSAGLDLFAIHDNVIPPGLWTAIPLGIASEFPAGFVVIFKDRSSVASLGLHVRAGVIDADYRGEWKVLLYNGGFDTQTIFKGMKVAQALIVPSGDHWEVIERNTLSETARGDGGFGSSGQ